jgi:hypothetical protein
VRRPNPAAELEVPVSNDPGAAGAPADDYNEAEPSVHFDRTAGAQAGSGSLQFNFFYSSPSWAGMAGTPLATAPGVTEPGGLGAASGWEALARLAGALGSGQWREADMLTEHVMKVAVGRGSGEYLTDDDLRYFPCQALSAVDALWRSCSGGRFGFSAQRVTWEALGALGTTPTVDGDVEREFGSRVGWRTEGQWLPYEEYTFDLSAPSGHLPWFVYRHAAGWWLGKSCLICARLRDCS